MLFLRFLTYMALCAAPLAAFQGDGHDAVRERLEALLRVSDPTAGFLAVALGVAFLAGAAHALTPGHGKALVAAYLAGSKGTVWDAVYLGTVVTITHTASVFVLGLATLYASQHIQMEKIYAWLSIFSGLLIVVIGGSMLWSRWRALRAGGEQHAHDHSPGHSHSHAGGFSGWLTHAHSHEQGHSHSHSHSHERSLEHGHEHGHADGHSHEHSHADGHSHSHEHAAGDHSHSHGPGHTHAHEGHAHDHGHSHTHPAAAKAGRGSLLTLGISGGLVPCPEAMVVLLISITINRLLFGIVILIAFSLGLAAILIAIGVAMVLAGPTLNRFTKDGPLLRALPVGSAALVTLLGVAILFSAVNDAGMLRF